MTRLVDRLVCIYWLIDPRTNLVRYVGQAVDPQDRLRGGHLRWADKRAPDGGWLINTHCARWLRQLIDLGLEPYQVEAEWVTVDEANGAEEWHIQHLRECGIPLTNMTAGGESGWLQDASPEDRTRIARLGQAAWMAQSTFEERSAIARAAQARVPKDERSRRAAHASSFQTPESKLRGGRRARDTTMAKSKAERQAIRERARATRRAHEAEMSEAELEALREQRSAAGALGIVSRRQRYSPAEWGEVVRRGHETRRAREAADPEHARRRRAARQEARRRGAETLRARRAQQRDDAE